jgi:hypothetical protein
MPQRIDVPEQDPEWEPTVEQLLKAVYDIVSRLERRLEAIQVELNRLPSQHRYSPEDLPPQRLRKGDTPF